MKQARISSSNSETKNLIERLKCDSHTEAIPILIEAKILSSKLLSYIENFW